MRFFLRILRITKGQLFLLQFILLIDNQMLYLKKRVDIIINLKYIKLTKNLKAMQTWSFVFAQFKSKAIILHTISNTDILLFLASFLSVNKISLCGILNQLLLNITSLVFQIFSYM